MTYPTRRKFKPALPLIGLLFIFALSACSAVALAEEESASTDIEAALTNFVPLVSASGIVVPVEWALLSVSFSGIVELIAVEENQIVEKGELLLSLSGSEQLQAAVAGSQLEFIAASQAIQDLHDNADLASANAKEILEDAEREYNNIITPAPQVDIDQAFANMILLEDQLEKAEEDFEEFANKPEDNLVRAGLQSKLSQVRSNYDDAVRIYNAYSTPGNNTDIAIAEAELALAQQAFAEVESGPDPDALALAQARLDNANAQLGASMTALEDLQLRAPFSGTVGQILVRENEWVLPGQPAIAIGDFSLFHVETTDLNEVDVARIQLGDKAIISFDSLPGVTVDAEVILIAAKSTPGEGVNYKVTLELQESLAGLLWDMTALVEFPIGD